MRVQHVRLLGHRDRLARKPLAFFELAAPREHLALHLAPQDLRAAELARICLATTLDPLLGVVVSPERSEGLREIAAEPHEVAHLG